MISVTVHDPGSGCLTPAAWDDLVSRAQPNVFMNPVALQAAAETGFAAIHVLLAWDQSAPTPRLVGMWALRERRPLPFWPAILDALPYEYAFLSSPVIDRAAVARVMPAFLQAIRSTPGLPRVLSLTSLDAEAASFNALRSALAERQGACLELHAEQRPMAERNNIGKQSGERRKKMRQHWRRLGALGATAVAIVTDPAELATTLEMFLQLELRSWKGAAGTALLCSDADATFARRLIANIAARGEAAIQTLRVGERIIAAQVLMFSGRVCYTWKTAYDAEFAKFSPGVLLIDALPDKVAEKADIVGFDSCAAESSFMGELWAGRRRMVDLLVDVGPGTSLAFRLEALRLTARQRLKTWRDRIRARFADSRPQKSAQGAPPAAITTAGV